MFRPEYLAQPPAWFYSRILVGAGGMLTASFVSKHNITHVINCAMPEDSPPWFRGLYRSRYKCLSAVDSLNANILRWYFIFEQTMSAMLREKGSGTVFVHCQCGINRSAFLSLTYITKNFGFDFEETVKSLKRQRPCMFTNPIYMKQTKEFVSSLHGRVPGEKDSRNSRLGLLDGNSGLGSSGVGAGNAGNQDKDGGPGGDDELP